MKFEMTGDIAFEAKDIDEALLKLGLHFISQMGSRPIYIPHDKSIPAIDVLGVLIDGTKKLTDTECDGFINTDILSDFDMPEMMQ